ncbi:MAG: hypothetical protein R2710_08245 [Acidimicrobiales bacterium]
MTVSFGFEGDFRRPLTEGFNSVSGSQIVAANEPALVFSATTTMVPGSSPSPTTPTSRERWR